MKKQTIQRSPHQCWAEFRFGVIGGLLSDPPAKGELHSRLQILAQIQWTHPMTEEKTTIALSTIERWYYAILKQNQDPLKALRRKLREDSGSTRQFSAKKKLASDELPKTSQLEWPTPQRQLKSRARAKS